MTTSATLNIGTEEASQQQPTIAERRALLERVAGSLHFRKSTRLRDFLLYVGTQALEPNHPDIHEQEIGEKVFGRDPSYDTSQDNIVRVNATELRKRIDLYFAQEGVGETLILEIPRGGYKPLFHHRLSIPNPPSAPDPAQTPPSPAATSTVIAHAPRNIPSILLMVACAVLVIACVLLALQNRSMRQLIDPWHGKPAIAAFWGDFLRSHQQTDIILPDDSVSVIEDITHQPVSLNDYLNRNYMRQIQSSDMTPDRKVDLDQLFNHNLITYGGIRAAQQALAFIPASYAPRLTLSRYYLADALKRNNVILIGGKKANPWVHLFDGQVNFITDYDDATSRPFVRNIHPKPGELALYPVPVDPNVFVGYSVIAYMPNPSRTGNAIILAGTDSDATDAAAEFLTSEPQLENFRNTLHVKSFPYFEVLLKTSRLSGTSLNAEVLAYRTYPDLH